MTNLAMKGTRSRRRAAAIAALSAIVCALAATSPADAKKGDRGGRAAAGPPASFSGSIASLEHGRNGNVSHAVLADGTRVHFTLDQRGTADALKVGAKISGSGMWRQKREGRAITYVTLNR